jgi:nicotinate-nucleotide adenylyltransferase
LGRVVFVPARLPPHKLDHVVSPVEHRLAMVELAIASNPHFAVSRVDIDRSGPSYTLETIELLRDAWGPDVEIYFIMGSDSLLDILTWHEPRRLIKLCHFAVVSRPGYQVNLDELDVLLPGVASRVQMLKAPELAISSTDIQRRVQEGLPIKYQVPEAVEDYIYQHKLYQN